MRDARKIRVEQGDTLSKMLSDAGVSASEGNEVISALTKKMNLRKLQVGQILHLYLLPHATPGQPFQLMGLILDQGRKKNWALYRNNDYRFSTQRLPFGASVFEVFTSFQCYFCVIIFVLI